MAEKRARLRFEMKNGSYMLSKLTDIDSGLIIPTIAIKFEQSIDRINSGERDTVITITVPLEEMLIDDFEAEIVRSET